MKNIKLILCGFIVLLNINNGLSQVKNSTDLSPKDINKIDRILKLANEHVGFNGTLLLADSNGILYHNSIGFADTTKTRKLTTAHQISPGSVGKEFTTVAIMMLVEQGKLNYEDNLSKYVTNLPSWSSQITIENILAHTSGLPGIKWKRNITTDDVMSQLMAVEKLEFKPGDGFGYNNLNVILRAVVVEKVTNAPFATFFKNNILIPSGMLQTLNKIHIDNDPASFVYGDIPSAILGVTMYSTVLDLYRFEKALWGGLLVSKTALKKGLTPHLLSGDYERTYFDFGWFTKNASGEITEMTHDGSNANQHSLKVSDFDKGLIVIIMSNDSRKSTPFELSDYVLNFSEYNATQIPLSWWFTKEIKRVGFDTAIADYKKNMQNNNQLINDEFSIWVYGYIMMLKGELDNAIEILKINMENFPESADAYDSYAELLIQAEKFKEAKPVIKKGLKLAKKSNNPNLTLSLTDKWDSNFK